MRLVTTREFQQNLHKELQDLPLIVTRRGEKAFLVTEYTPEMLKKHVTTLKPNVTTLPSKVTTNVTTSSKGTKSTSKKTMGEIPDRKNESWPWPFMEDEYDVSKV